MTSIGANAPATLIRSADSIERIHMTSDGANAPVTLLRLTHSTVRIYMTISDSDKEPTSHF